MLRTTAAEERVQWDRSPDWGGDHVGRRSRDWGGDHVGRRSRDWGGEIVQSTFGIVRRQWSLNLINV